VEALSVMFQLQRGLTGRDTSKSFDVAYPATKRRPGVRRRGARAGCRCRPTREQRPANSVAYPRAPARTTEWGNRPRIGA